MKLGSAIFGGMIAFGLLTSSASAQDFELAPPVKQCIDANAPNVERTVASLTDATSFLLDNICADVIAAEDTRQRKEATQKMVDGYQRQCAALKPAEQAVSDPETLNPCAMAKSMSDASAGLAWTLIGPSRPEPIMTTYAAKLLLSLRLAHTK